MNVPKLVPWYLSKCLNSLFVKQQFSNLKHATTIYIHQNMNTKYEVVKHARTRIIRAVQYTCTPFMPYIAFIFSRDLMCISYHLLGQIYLIWTSKGYL